jgi:hypothetical protein
MMFRHGSRVVLVCVVVLGSACSGSIKDDTVTEVNKTTLLGQIKHSRDLTIEEVGLLQGSSSVGDWATYSLERHGNSLLE